MGLGEGAEVGAPATTLLPSEIMDPAAAVAMVNTDPAKEAATPAPPLASVTKLPSPSPTSVTTEPPTAVRGEDEGGEKSAIQAYLSSDAIALAYTHR